LPQRAEAEKPVDCSQQVIGRSPIFEVKLIKKRRLTVASLPHHGRAPDPTPYRITADARLQPTLSTKSAPSCRCRGKVEQCGLFDQGQADIAATSDGKRSMANSVNANPENEKIIKRLAVFISR
jgi:hypothetical protein